MSDFASEVLKRYGTAAGILALVVAVAVWGLAHFAAAPGSEVSVVWGLVKYTKKPSSAPSSFFGAPKASSHRAGRAKQSSIELLLRTGVDPDNLDDCLGVLRSQQGLRELTAAESGRVVGELPSGTYFYVSAYLLEPPLAFADEAPGGGISGLEVSRYRLHGYAEVHKLQGDEPHLVLFFDELAAAMVSKLPGDQPHEVTAAILPWGSATTLASVPVSRVVASRVRRAEVSEDHSVVALDMVLQ